MRDLTSAFWIKFKGGLFLALGLLAGGLLLADDFSWPRAGLLALTVWAFCRSYYFAFYVIEKYVDPAYKFAGLLDFFRYVTGRRRQP
jgi:hypothetical protein